MMSFRVFSSTDVDDCRAVLLDHASKVRQHRLGTEHWAQAQQQQGNEHRVERLFEITHRGFPPAGLLIYETNQVMEFTDTW